MSSSSNKSFANRKNLKSKRLKTRLKPTSGRLVVVPFSNEGWVRSEPCPWALIVAVEEDEEIHSDPRLCIAFYFEDGEITCGDGVFAAEGNVDVIPCRVRCMPLAMALRHDRKEWAAMLHFDREDEVPFINVMNWHNKHTFKRCPEEQLGPTDIFRSLERWERWQKGDVPRYDRMCEITSRHVKITGKNADAKISRFSKTLAAVGFKSEYKEPTKPLIDALYEALGAAASFWV